MQDTKEKRQKFKRKIKTKDRWLAKLKFKKESILKNRLRITHLGIHDLIQ